MNNEIFSHQIHPRMGEHRVKVLVHQAVAGEKKNTRGEFYF